MQENRVTGSASELKIRKLPEVPNATIVVSNRAAALRVACKRETDVHRVEPGREKRIHAAGEANSVGLPIRLFKQSTK
jgi:hypothetical protein